MKQDPKWTEFSASLRKDDLYVKLPLSKAKAVMAALTRVITAHKLPILKAHPLVDLYKFLWKEARRATNSSLFYALPVKEAEVDVEILQAVEGEDEYGILRRFRKTLQAGLAGSPEVDWILRVGGPKVPPDLDDLPAPKISPGSGGVVLFADLEENF